MKKRLFENYSYYLPGARGMFALFLMFLLGAVLGNIVALPLAALLPAESATDWITLITYPIMFLPPMLYARSKSKAELVGGIVLICMGTKILLEHLGIIG